MLEDPSSPSPAADDITTLSTITSDGKEPEPSKNEPNQTHVLPRTEPNPKVEMCKNPNHTEPYRVKNETEP